jgi:hypothetical protein
MDFSRGRPFSTWISVDFTHARANLLLSVGSVPLSFGKSHQTKTCPEVPLDFVPLSCCHDHPTATTVIASKQKRHHRTIASIATTATATTATTNPKTLTGLKIDH